MPQPPVAAGRATRSARPARSGRPLPLLSALLVLALVAGLVVLWLPSALQAAPGTGGGPQPLTEEEQAFARLVQVGGIAQRERKLLDELRRLAERSPRDANLQREAQSQELVVRIMDRAEARANDEWVRAAERDAAEKLAAARERFAQDPSPQNQEALEFAEDMAADARRLSGRPRPARPRTQSELDRAGSEALVVARAARRKLRQLEATLATGLPTEVRKQLQGQAAEVRAVLDQVEGEAQATEVAARQLGLQESQQRLAEAADALARNPSPGNQRRHEAAQLEVTKAKVRLKRVTAALNPSGGNQPPEGGQNQPIAVQDPVVVVPAPVEPPPVDAKQHLLPVPGTTSLSNGGPPVAPPPPPPPPAEPGKQQEPAAPVQPVAEPPPPPPPPPERSRKSDRSNNEPAPVEAAPAQIVPAGLGITLEAVPKSPVLVPPPGFVTAAPQISLTPDTSTEINLDQLAGGSIFDGGQSVLAPEPAPAPDMGAAAKVAADIGAGAGGSQPAPAPPADTGAVRDAAAGLGGGAGSPPAEPVPATFDDPCNSTIAGSGPC